MSKFQFATGITLLAVLLLTIQQGLAHAETEGVMIKGEVIYGTPQPGWYTCNLTLSKKLRITRKVYLDCAPLNIDEPATATPMLPDPYYPATPTETPEPYPPISTPYPYPPYP